MRYVLLSLLIVLTFSYSTSALSNQEALTKKSLTVKRNKAAIGEQSGLFLAPVFGGTSTETSMGNKERKMNLSYGAEAMYIRNRFGAALRYSTYSMGPEGTQQVSIEGRDHWVNLSGKFRFWDQNFSPYASAGGGVFINTISTTLMGTTEDRTSSSFVYDLGIGLFGKLGDRFGINISADYYNYSNVSGFTYLVSFGYFIPQFLSF